MIGQTVSHYKILEKLGEGGMGVVYKAEDTKLKRTVALKFLPAHAVGEGEHRARFEREAQAAASLNHPNICTVYEIDENNGRPFIAMEFVDGETLAALVEKGPRKIDEALDIAIQAARGLAEAHGRGIVHRDIKSANIMVAPERTGQERQVKLMDFGLAQLATARTQLTKEGSTLGTMAYMAPEQARGEKVDQRADIWALGVVLYELVAGRQPYRGDYEQAVLYSILNEAPEPLTAVRTGVPKELERIVDKALAKDATVRYQHSEDMLVDLRALRSDLAVQRSRQAPAGLQPTGMKRPVAWVGVAAALAVAAVFVWFQFKGRPVTPGGPAPVAVPFTSMPGVERDPALSPDGRQIAFTAPGSTASDWDIYVKQVGSPGQIRLTTGPHREYGPAWSPDGQQIAFTRILEDKQEILLMPALGGPERKLLEVVHPRRERLAWHPAGKYLAIVGFVDQAGVPWRTPISSISIETGETRNLTEPVRDFPVLAENPAGERGAAWDMQPAFSPDGRYLAFVRLTSAWVGEIHVLELGSDGTPRGDPRRLTFDQRDIQGLDWTADSRSIIFSSNRAGGQALWRIAIDGGEPERLVVGGDDASLPSVSRTGARLAYVQSTFDPNIWRVPGPHAPPAESGASTSGAKEFIASTREDLSPDYSPDGKRIAFDSNRGGTQEIWVCDSDGSNAVQLTSFGGPPVGVPRWSPDGQWVAFDSRKEGDADVYIVAASGGAARRLTLDPGYDARPSWSADGRWIYFASLRSGDIQIWKIPSQGGEAVQITFQGGRQAFESADGTTVYYVNVGVDGVWRVPAAGGEETKILDSGRVGQWALLKDGICYIDHSLPGIQFLDFAAGRSTPVWHFTNEVPLHPDSFAASPDGRWILYVQNDRNESDIMLVENFR